MGDYRTRIGQLITSLRTRNHMTQAELAKQLGTSQSAINRIEKGAQNVSLDILSRLSQVLDCDIINIGKLNNLNLLITGGKSLATPSPIPDVDDMSLVALATAALITHSEITIESQMFKSSNLAKQYFALIKQLGASYDIDNQVGKIKIKQSNLACPELFEISAQQFSGSLFAILPILVTTSGTSIIYSLDDVQPNLVNVLCQFSISHSYHNGTLVINGGNITQANTVKIAQADSFPLATLLSFTIPQTIKLYDLANDNYKYNELYKSLRLYSTQIETLHEI